MTHRFQIQASELLTTILFHGRLDRGALAELAALCGDQRRSGLPLRVRLGAGTRVEPELMDALVRIDGVELEAESPFLARWIQSCLDGGGKKR